MLFMLKLVKACNTQPTGKDLMALVKVLVPGRF